MALPNGDLITTVFDPQMAYPIDKRMQVDTLNSRDSISMYIRWEGMTVYVLEDSKIYILQGGRSNEYWKELGTGTGTGGTTFVGQFPTADLLPTSGRSAGDYAFVGTGEDFVQYNWDNIANEWVMAEGQTDMASEFFHIGYKTPLRRPVIFPLFPKDILVEESGDFVFSPETGVARFIFVGEVEAIKGIETAEEDREIKLVNRTGSDIILRNKASGIPSGSGFDFGGTDYTWANGSEITLKGNGTYWELAPNNQIAFSDHLDSVNAKVSVGSDGLEVISEVFDKSTGELVNFKEISDALHPIDGVLFVEHNGKIFERQFTGPINIKWFGANGNSSVDDTEAISNCFSSLKILRDYNRSKNPVTDGLITLLFPTGVYNYSQDININDIGGVYIVGDGITNTILNYTGTGTAISIGDGVTRARYFGLSNFGLRNSTQNAEGAINLTYANEGYIEDVWVNGSDTGFHNFGVKLSGQGSNRCWTVRFRNVRVTNIAGIGFFLSGTTGHNAIFFNGCSSSFCYTGLWVETANGCSFNDFQSEASSSGKEIRIGPHSSTFSRILGLTFNAVYIECGSGLDGRAFYITDLKSDDSTSAVTSILGINILGLYAWGTTSSKYAIEINTPSRSGLVTGHITGGLIHGFTDAVIKSEDSQHRLIFEPNLSPNGFGLGSYIPYLENTGIRDSGISVITSANTTLFSKPLGLTHNPRISPTDEGSLWYNSTSKKPTYHNGNTAKLIADITTSTSVPSESNMPRVVGATYFKTPSKSTFVWDGTAFFDIRNRIMVDKTVTGPSYTFSTSDKENYVRILGSGSSLVPGDGRFSAGDEILGHAETGDILITGSLGATVISNTNNIVPKGCRFHVKIIDSTTAILSVSDTYHRTSKEIDAAAISNSDRGYYLRFIGSSGNVSIIADRFSENEELIGEIEGGAKTFVAGTGVTLRYPDGQGLVAPTGSRFIIKFKSSNDALVTIIKPTGATTFPELTDTPADYTGHKNKSVKVNNEETALVFVADGVDVRNITDGGSIAPTLTDGFIGSRLNFTSSTAVTLQGFASAGGQSSLTLVNPHATNNLTLVHNGSATVKYIDAGATDLVVAPKTAVKLEIVGNEIYRVL